MPYSSRTINKGFLIAFALTLAALAGLLTLGLKAEAASPPADAKPGSTLQQRIAQRKQERQIKLDKNDTVRLQAQCTAAQGRIRTMGDSYTTATENRDKVYRGIDAKIWIIIGSLKLINKDTYRLEQQRVELAKKIKAFDNQSAQFRQALGDITAMNCAADPTGFTALLETARLYNVQIRNTFKSIQSYIVDQVKPTITQQANDLKLNTTTEN